MASLNFLIHRLLSFPLNEQRFAKEKAFIKDVAMSNGYPLQEKASSGDESKENETEMHLEQSIKSSDVKLIRSQEEENRSNNESTAPLSINCDTQSLRTEVSTPMQSPKRRLSDLLSPSELLDNPLDFDDIDHALNETVPITPKSKKSIECFQPELEKVLEQTVKLTEGYSLVSLLDLHNQLSRIIKRYSRTHIRTALPKELTKELSRFKKGVVESTNTF